MPRHGAPAPSLNLQIPSLHDSLLLPARLYLPPTYTHPHPRPWPRRLAVLAHPYAPLGGSYDDRTVLRLAALLVSLDWVVATFNFRGAPGARGATSWTGRAEVADYTSVAAWALAYVQSLPPPPGAVVVGTDSDATVQLLLGGYSYGSLVAARLPGTQAGIVGVLGSGSGSGEFTVALEAARKSARGWWDSHGVARTSYSGSTAGRAEVLRAAEGPALPLPLPVPLPVAPGDVRWTVVARYLLVSPPLPPVSSFLMGFGAGSWAGWAKGLVGMQHRGHKDGDDGGGGGFGIEESGVRVLAVYGDGDTFTGVKKYRRWRERMMATSASWSGVEVEGAGHFWHEAGVMEELEGAVRTWIEGGGGGGG